MTKTKALILVVALAGTVGALMYELMSRDASRGVGSANRYASRPVAHYTVPDSFSNGGAAIPARSNGGAGFNARSHTAARGETTSPGPRPL